jgi:hypothetical protein
MRFDENLLMKLKKYKHAEISYSTVEPKLPLVRLEVCQDDFRRMAKASPEISPGQSHRRRPLREQQIS